MKIPFSTPMKMGWVDGGPQEDTEEEKDGMGALQVVFEGTQGEQNAHPIRCP